MHEKCVQGTRAVCGIAGIVDAKASSRRDAIERMTAAIAHRGPDGAGHGVFDGCVLGHRRLSIVDMTTGGQPMASAVARAAITFNGEIYGYRELRASLAEYPFRTTSDTEVILALYDRYGERFVERLPGMFAFAIWDEDRRRLVAARDRFGEKPFFYASGRDGAFVFASEIKAVLASGLVEPEIDPAAVSRYLQRQCVPPGQTIYRNVASLPPAHTLVVEGGAVTVRRYWEPPDVEERLSVDEAAEELRSRLSVAVGKQLVADVAVGAFLSGGLDSTTICRVASRQKPDLRTFSFDFQGDLSEARYARAAAAAYGTVHTELRSDRIDVADALWRMREVYDEPFADTSAIPTYFLCAEARRHVKVALTGDGGDELFGGYSWYRPLVWAEREGRVGLLRWTAARLANRAARMLRLPSAETRDWRVTGMGLARNSASILAAHRRQLDLFSGDDLARLGLPTVAEVGESDSLDAVLRYDVEGYMAADILTKIDRASMAHGLELRAPFLDVDLATFCMALPWRMKVTTDDDKIVLRRAFAAEWPAEIRARRKQGFGAPFYEWLRDARVRELEAELVLAAGAPLRTILDGTGVQSIHAGDNEVQRWNLLVLAVWMSGGRQRIRVGDPSLTAGAAA